MNGCAKFKMSKEVRLEVTKILHALAKAFVHLVETHKADFGINGDPKGNMVGAIRTFLILPWYVSS